MTEEKNDVTNGPAANTEMAPQEDGTKVPLTDGPEQVKFTGANPPNGDAKIDLGAPAVFSGLTKDELMKYSEDPYWVRLRWILFILFWAGWAAMLVMAIVIIIQAPRCTPKETLEWIQESPMVQYDVNNDFDADNSNEVNENDMTFMAKELGMKTVYLEDLISPQNFENINTGRYDEVEIMAILEAAKTAGLQVVTDFVPSQVNSDNNWRNDSRYDEFFKPNSGQLDFANPDLLDALIGIFEDPWMKRGVKGYLVEAPTVELQNASDIISAALAPEEGAVVYGVVDMKDQLVSGFNAKLYQEFLDEHAHMANWTYYKYNPKVAESTGTVPSDIVRLVTLSLFLVPGTPIVSGLDNEYFDNQKDIMKTLSELRGMESVQVGDMFYVNTTETQDVIAYVRVMKGTPGYAVAVNMDDTRNATVDFTTVNGVASEGDCQIKSTPNQTIKDAGREDLASVFLLPLEGIVVQFVPDY